MPVPKVVIIPQETAAQLPAVGQSGFPNLTAGTSSSRHVRSQPPKSPGIALLLSFLWIGLGQFYNGEIAKGVVLMFVLPLVMVGVIAVIIAAMGEEGIFTACAVWGCLGICIWFYGMFDAYSGAQRHNRRQRRDPGSSPATRR